MILIILTFILFITTIWWIFSLKKRISYKIPYIEEELEEKNLPYLSIIIPARNEEKYVRNTLNSLKEQDFKNFEIIFVDDNSQDKTLDIVKEFEGVRILSLKGVEEGWVGKNWACYNGAKLAKGEWLLFLDADSKLERDTLRRALGFSLKRNLDILSLAPNINCIGFWSKVTTPLYLSLMNLFLPYEKVNNPKDKRVYLFGSFILIKRSTYWKMGGHEAVKGEMVEDRALGSLAKEKGFRVMLVKGNFTSYWVSGFKNLWQAIVRIFFQSVKKNRRGALLFSLSLFIIGVLPFITLILAPLFLKDFLFPLIFSLISYLIPVIMVSREKLKVNPLYYFLHPLAFLLLIAAILFILFKAKGVFWRGRYFKIF